MPLGVHVKIVCMGPCSPLLATCSGIIFLNGPPCAESGALSVGAWGSTAVRIPLLRATVGVECSTNKSRKTWS